MDETLPALLEAARAWAERLSWARELTVHLGTPQARMELAEDHRSGTLIIEIPVRAHT